MDLHIHTPASSDFKQSGVTYLDILKKAEEKNLDVIAFADHNSIAGYAALLDEIESLEMLERLKRLRDDEKKRLEEYRRLREKILLLPGFEFTATLGFHILGIFPPDTTVREIEHLLLSLRVPDDKLDQGSGEVGATSDVLTAYRMINEAGGLVIAAHANSSHGVAMPGFDFGGQTRIAYTQDPNLHALEVTDLESTSRRRTAAFFSGTKPEYPRRMHCIQGSDSHKLDFDPKYKNEMGLGDRATEILLDELSFDAIKNVFLGNDFSRTRPYRPAAQEPFDPLRDAREQGDNLVQAFHEHLLERRNIARSILEDVVALANTNGGTIYIGASADMRKHVVGVERPEHAIAELRNAIQKQVTPPLEVQIETLKSQNKNVLQVIVPRGSDVPYALDGSHIYVRSENETSLAVRDEIVQLVRDALAVEFAALRPEPKIETSLSEPVVVSASAPKIETITPTFPPPRTGVEIVSAEQRKGVMYYSVRDLRNNRVVHNVTLASARRLWQYAITEREKAPCDINSLPWVGDLAICKTYKRGGKVRYDLAQRKGNSLFVYYGVTDDGIHGPWRALVEGEPIPEEAIPEIPDTEARIQAGTPAEIGVEYTPEPELLIEPGEESIEAESTHPLIIEEEISEPETERAEVGTPAEIASEESEAQEQPVEPAPEPVEAEMFHPPMPSEETPPPPEAMTEQTPTESTPPWVEEVASAKAEEPATPSSAESLMPAESLPPEASLPGELTSTEVASTFSTSSISKSTAQTWREKLERAKEEARKAKEAAEKKPGE
jgi:hypothetical protein